MRTIIISEIGENHLGDMKLAADMIRASKEAGADYAKFQLYDPARTKGDDPEREWFFKVALSKDKMARLAAECRKAGIRPLFSCWDTTRAQWCLDEGLAEIKLSSFHIADKALLDFAAGGFRTVFLSTGMGSIDEIKKAAAALKKVENLYLLHCVSDYPARPQDVNLKAMDQLRQFCGHVGYSDHLTDISAALAAVARGAEVIEKHFTMDKKLPGTDHILSASPAEFKEMVARIREIEDMLGDGKRQLTASEAKNRDFLRARFTH